MADGAAVADDQAFPDRQLTILSVDDSLICLKILEAKLLQCKYHVISTNSAMEALDILRAKQFKFDIIITDVHMPGMDGFGLLEQVGLEMHLPCIMVSGDDDPKTVLKGIEHGACDYLLKPVRIQELRTIWKHIPRKEKVNKVSKKHSGNATSDSRNENVERRKRKRQDGEEEDEGDKEEPKKKKRMVWTEELHSKFIEAIKTLGEYKVLPIKILEIMKVEGLTREHVASHLQKYRNCLRKLDKKANMIVSMGPQSHLPLVQPNQQNIMGSQSHLPLLQYGQQNTMGPPSYLPFPECRQENTMGPQSHLPLLQSSQENTIGPQSHLPLLEYRQENTMGPQSHLTLLQSSQKNTMGPQSHLPFFEYRQENTMGPQSHLPLLQSSQENNMGPQSRLPLLQSSEQSMMHANTNIHQGLPRPETPYPITNLGSGFHLGIASNKQAGPSSLSIGLPQSFSPNPARSFSAMNTLSMTSGLSPRATLNASYMPLNYPLSRNLESLNINSNTSNFSGTNQDSLVFNARIFATGASQGHNTAQNFPLSRGMNQGSLNVNFGNFVSGTSQGFNTTQNFNSGNFDFSGNSQNQMLDNAMGRSGVAMNVTDQPDYNSNVNPGQQFTLDRSFNMNSIDFGREASQRNKTTWNDVFASSGNSQNQVFYNAMSHSEVAVDIRDQPNHNSNVIPGQQFMFDAENQFESWDDAFIENSLMQGEVGLSANMFSDLEVLLNPDELDAWLPDNDQEPNH